ncbi:MAG: ice-binding family protein, partial [Acidobacteriota bacterium]
LTAAFADASARASGAVPVTGDIAGQTFTPGLYKSVSSLNISAGDITLDAKGDSNAVFVFQVASTLTTAAGRQIILIGGAKPFNVFWQVGTSATLGTNSVFQGSILAGQAITVSTGGSVTGRLLAISGAVTLQSATVSSPPPGIFPGGIINAASDTLIVAPGSIAAVFGNNLGSSLMSAGGYPLPLTLGGTSFLAGSTAAPLFMSSCGQANIQIPWEATGASLQLTATAAGVTSASAQTAVAAYAPGIFSLNMAGTGQGAVEVAPTAQLAAPLSPAGHPVQRGEYVAIFCTGLGPVTNQPATGVAASSSPLSFTTTLPVVSIGGALAQVTYSGLAPGFAGLYQVNAIVPAGATSGSSVPLLLTIGGIASNTVTIAVQ